MKLMKSLSLRTLLFTLFILSGCAEDLKTDPGDTTESLDTTETVSLISSTTNEDGSTSVVVDASSKEIWVYFDFELGLEVYPESEDASLVEEAAQWDLGFQRQKIKSNGGITGSGGVEIARLAGVDFDTLTEAPVQGYQTDQEDSDDVDVDPDYVFLGATPWYDYDPQEHTLSPADVVYVVHSVEGNYYKVQMEGYYKDPGISGHPAFRWAQIDGPSEEIELAPDEILIEAQESGEWKYVDIIGRSIVEVDDPATSTDWDIAVSRTQFQTNSGTSGSGLAGAIEIADAAYEDIKTCPTVGFAKDAMVPLPGPPGSGEFSGNPVLNDWYDYDMETHGVSPKDTSFVIRTAGGKYLKMQILTYEDGVMKVRTGPVEKTAAKHSTDVDVSEDEKTTYLHFDSGTEVVPEAASESTEWDLAISKIWLQTNSGTSGPGEGGALDMQVASLDEISSVPSGAGCYLAAAGHVCKCEMTEEECAAEPGAWTPQCACPTDFVVDELLPLPGPPGSGESSGNSALAEWYDYDMTTHTATPKEAAYVIRTAAGDFVKIQITGYAEGTMTIHWSYAGPKQNNF